MAVAIKHVSFYCKSSVLSFCHIVLFNDVDAVNNQQESFCQHQTGSCELAKPTSAGGRKKNGGLSQAVEDSRVDRKTMLLLFSQPRSCPHCALSFLIGCFCRNSSLGSHSSSSTSGSQKLFQFLLHCFIVCQVQDGKLSQEEPNSDPARLLVFVKSSLCINTD